jgi:hypothetical protein
MLARRIAVALFSTATLLAAADDPRLSSWLVAPTNRYARLYENDAAKNSGSAVVTWSRGQGTQSSPVYGGAAQVSYSANWVYLRTSGLGLHTMGPWYLDAAHTQNFPSFPANSATIYRLPRAPSIPTTKTLTGLGAIGYFVDGVAMFDNRDGFSYSNPSGRDADPTNGLTGDGIWIRDAYANEGVTFDPANAHQAGPTYHYHANPPALRYHVNDHVNYNATAKTYAESTATPAHSPILGWVRDGFPIYGPYGYASAMDPASGVRRMISGYVKRDGANGTTNLATTGRTTLPAWAMRAQARTAPLTGSQYGPAVNATYAVGHYLEDYDYLGDLGKTQGADFDLDSYNGRFCVTPEFPSGTYAYFVAIETDGTPKFPYNIGRWFYGDPTGAAVTSISETVTAYATGGPAASIGVTATAAGAGVMLAWNSAEGATYSVESSSNNATWSTLAGAITSGGASTTYSAAVAANYFRVTLVAIATYDTRGTVGTPVGTSGIATFSTGTGAPTIVTQPAAVVTSVGGAVTFTINASGTAPLSFQWFRNAIAIVGATSATLALTAAQTADAGTYTVVVSNSAGSVTSQPVVLTLASAGQSVVGTGYLAGGTATLAHTLAYTGTLTRLSWQVLLPAGWSFASSDATGFATGPASGVTALAEWTWTNVPASPLSFRAVLNVLATASGGVAIAAIVNGTRADGSTFQLLVQPDPLTAVPAPQFHSADSDQNGAVSLVELTRVIELYNTRTGSVRTGRYRVEPTSEDGFAPWP